MKENLLIVADEIKNKIFIIRGVQVMLDSDLAEMYKVETKRLNEQVRRNLERFPKEFMFQLSEKEKKEVVANCDHPDKIKFSPQLPYVFTEQGVSMLSAVLKSKVAVKISIQIINAFISMRKILSENGQFFNRLDSLEKRQIKFEIKTDEKFDKIFNLLENNSIPKKGIYFEGEVFDAHKFISDLIRSATKSIILIDNYVDDTTLNLFAKRKKGIKVIILTKKITPVLKDSLNKFNSQYELIDIKEFDKSHDRFIIIDDNEFYHIGASLKDLGKKWVGFSKFDKECFEALRKIRFKIL